MKRSTLIIAMAVASAWSLAADRYAITPIGVLEDDALSTAYSVSDSGYVAGTSKYAANHPVIPGFPRAFVWKGGVMTALPPTILGFQLSNAFDVNDSGQVVGTAEYEEGSRGFLYQNGSISILPQPVPGSLSISRGFAINNAGQIAGAAKVGNSNLAFRYSSATNTMMNLGSFNPGQAGFGIGINSGGQVLGYDDTGSGGSWLFTGNLDGFGDPEMIQYGTGLSHKAINDLGDTVAINSVGKSFLRLNDGTLIALNPLVDDPEMIASSVNNHRQIVGHRGRTPAKESNYSFSFLGAEGNNPYLWENGTRYELNTLVDTPGYLLLTANDINNSGQIVGSAIDLASGKTIAYLASPVPEPGSMIALGLGTLALLRRKRSKKA